jgi:hypothetical protein
MNCIKSKLAKSLSVFVGVAALCTCAHANWVTWTVASGGNGHSYLAVPGYAGLTWNAANTAAQAQGGYLATITSAAENAFVFNLVNSPQFFTALNGCGPALGGVQIPGSAEPAAGWSWQTGETWAYTNWRAGEPNNQDGFAQEDRLTFFSYTSSTPSSLWGDLPQNDTNIGGYVIEVVPEPSTFAFLGLGAVFMSRTVRSRLSKQSAPATLN